MIITKHKPFHSAFEHLGKLLALHLFIFAGLCLLGTNNQLDHTFGLGLPLSNPTACFNFSISSLLDCQSFLNYPIFDLVGGALASDSVHPVQWTEKADSFTDVSECSIVIVVLMILLAAGTSDIVSGIGVSSHRLTYCFPGMLVVLVVISALGVWTLACSLSMLSMTADVLDELNLGLVLFPSPQISSLSTPGSSFILTDSEFCLIITTVLLFIGELVAADGIATADVATDRTEVSEWLIAMWAILVLMNLCAAGIVLEFGSSLDSLYSCSFPGLLLVQVIALGVGLIAFCLLVLLHDVLHLELGLLLSNRTSFTTPGSPFILTDSKFLLIIIIIRTVLVFIGGLVAVYELTTADVANKWLIAIVVLMNLCAAGIVGIVPEFGGTLCSVDSYSFPSMKVVLVFIGLGVDSTTFYRLVMTTKVLDQLNLGLGLFLSFQISCFTTPISRVSVGLNQIFAIVVLMNLWTAGIVDTALGFSDSVYSFNSSVFRAFRWRCWLWLSRWVYLLPSSQITSLARRNKFNIDFRVVAGWSKHKCLGLRLSRVKISGLGHNCVGYGSFNLAINRYWGNRF